MSAFLVFCFACSFRLCFVSQIQKLMCHVLVAGGCRQGGDSSRRSGRAAAADPGHARRLWEQEQQEQQKQQEQQEQQERLGGGDGVGVGCAWGRSNLATAGSTEEQMAEGRGGIDANGGRGLGRAEGAPLPLNQGDFFAFTPAFGRFRRFFGRSGPRTRYRPDGGPGTDKIRYRPQKRQIRPDGSPHR